MKVYYEKDANLGIIKSKKIAVIGYGSQGYGHSNNLKDSGCDVAVALRKESASWKKAEYTISANKASSIFYCNR